MHEALTAIISTTKTERKKKIVQRIIIRINDLSVAHLTMAKIRLSEIP
jgi:hypothetical protein